MKFTTTVPANDLYACVREAARIYPDAKISTVSGEGIDFSKITVETDAMNVCKLCEAIGFPKNTPMADCDICREKIY